MWPIIDIDLLGLRLCCLNSYVCSGADASDCLWEAISFIVTGSGTSFLGSTINENQVQVIALQGWLLQEELICAINESY